MFFQNPAKGRNDWFLYISTIAIVAFCYILGQMPMTLVIFMQMNKNPALGMDSFLEFQETLDFSIFDLSSNVGFFLALCIFIFAFAGLFLSIKLLHKRNLLSLVNWWEKLDWKRILWAWSFWMILSIIFESFMYFYEPENYTFNSPDISFLVLLFISIAILPIQTSFEELFFRGYLLQGIGYLTRNKWLALIFTALLFTAVHSMNPEIKEYGLLNMLPYYLFAGLFLGYITIMDNRLELALGVHAATNMFGSLFVTYEGAALQTGTLFKTHEVDPLVLSIVFLVFGLIFVLFSSYKYKWPKPGEIFNTWEEISEYEDPNKYPN